MATPPKTKKIMREFSLHEISAVTAPAQEGARMVLMKSADAPADSRAAHPVERKDGPLDLAKLSADQKAELIMKGRLLLTEPYEGHCHLVDVGPWAQERGGGTTDSCLDDGNYHSHPYVIGSDGTITIGMAKGHTHTVMSLAKVKAAALAASPGETQKGEDMDQKEVAKLRALADMNDAQKAHFSTLGAADQEAFVAMTPDQRTAAVAAAVSKAAGDNPVIYKARNGAEYRAKDDPRLVQMAKDRDADLAAADVAKAAQIEAEAAQLADSWHFISKSREEKIADAKAILSASPEAKKAALDSIAAVAKSVEPLFKGIGTQAGGYNTGAAGGAFGKSAAQVEAEDELTKMADKYATKHNVTKAVAMDAILDTPNGARAYSKANPPLGPQFRSFH